MVIVILAPLLFYVLVYLESVRTQDEHTVLKVRGAELANYMESISLDVPRILDITSKLAFVAALNEIDANGTALDDAQLRLTELMLNSTLYGQNSSFMNGSGLMDWANEMELLGSRFGLQTEIEILDLTVVPADSFTLNFSMTMSVKSLDSLTQIQVDRVYREYALVSVEGFEDPLYPLYTNGFVKRVVNRSNGSIYGIFDVNNASVLRLYGNSSAGASFLDRMEGQLNLSAKYNVSGNEGMESFVDLMQLSGVGIPVKTNQTVVDYLYFASTDIDGCTVNNATYGWFKLDVPSALTYGVSVTCS